MAYKIAVTEQTVDKLIETQFNIKNVFPSIFFVCSMIFLKHKSHLCSLEMFF